MKRFIRHTAARRGTLAMLFHLLLVATAFTTADSFLPSTPRTSTFREAVTWEAPRAVCRSHQHSREAKLTFRAINTWALFGSGGQESGAGVDDANATRDNEQGLVTMGDNFGLFYGMVGRAKQALEVIAKDAASYSLMKVGSFQAADCCCLFLRSVVLCVRYLRWRLVAAVLARFRTFSVIASSQPDPARREVLPSEQLLRILWPYAVPYPQCVPCN